MDINAINAQYDQIAGQQVDPGAQGTYANSQQPQVQSNPSPFAKGDGKSDATDGAKQATEVVGKVLDLIKSVVDAFSSAGNALSSLFGLGSSLSQSLGQSGGSSSKVS